MQTRRIPREQWPTFLDDFTRLHCGRHVSIESLGPHRREVRPLLHDRPLVSLHSEQPPGSGQCIELLAGDPSRTEFLFSIPNPSRILMAEEENGQAVAVQIDDTEGHTTLLRFEPSREAMPPGFVIQ